MYWLIAVMTLGIAGLIITGVIMEMQPAKVSRPWFKPTIGINLLVFVVAQAALIFMGANEVMAATEVAEAGGEISIGLGLGIIGVGIPTALSTIGAGIAVGPIGAASLAVLAEKPEIFGRTLIYLGLAEGIAIYGLVMSILLLDKI
ncbi:MAG: ATP synthase subunit C [Candidatus Thiodiazotropha endolucinida]|uniref:ATP synthase F(0) sector subunit c n=1 Tax=Candidatus Thiodiazotropha taylori TaxID=2792791 RepID=A0A9E4NUU2_9GAMM|nr:ATP synthase subunit C [Candidatus Thiodiazotropha sp. (ex Lucina pensylvanica)]MBT3015631.1 ATP synthase subunit C [Candidatus Thiodiazotropha taylori]MBT3039466.1 ATP synthase subunit C [Candidatus Thiodiazotropha sp. (ex Codakia orbicularis)]MBV2103511.1 ATP synthase subunit C [Candidatus Thiodiazotropha sp. (ex Lucina aurantia)]MCG7860878.1 ATP synthase subunit C [Candidatus Thiodiazotropha endolucinida]MCU7943984.1 ATP synthase subunit C [Candidatus Thiodiazotropha sp. (ex Cardiolucina